MPTRPLKIIVALLVLMYSHVACAQSMKWNGLSYTSTGTTVACLSGGCTTSPSQTNGTLAYVSDANQNLTCTSGGSGAWALRIAGAWNCATAASGISITGLSNPLTADLNLSNHTIFSGFATPLDVNGVVDAVNHGVVCDGSTDNNASTSGTLQTAIALACPGTITGILQVPSSCYGAAGHFLSYSTGITLPQNCLIAGLGAPAQAANGTRNVTLNYTGAGTAITNASGTVASVGLSNFKLQTTTGATGILYAGTFNSRIDGVLATGFSGAGIELSNSSTQSSNDNVVSQAQSYLNGYGLLVDCTVAANTKSCANNTYRDSQFITSNIANVKIMGNTTGSEGQWNANTQHFYGNNIAENSVPAIVIDHAEIIDFVGGFIENVSVDWQLTHATGISSRGVNIAASGLTAGPISADGLSTYAFDIPPSIGGSGYTISNLQEQVGMVMPTSIQDFYGQWGVGTAQNLIKDSEDLTTANWTTGGTITSRTANAAADPYGDSLATQVVVGASGTLRQTYSLGSSIAGLCWGGAVWAQAVSAGFNGFTINITDGTTGTTLGQTSVPLSTNWQYIYVSGTTSDTDTSVIFRPISGGATGKTVNLWGAQVAQIACGQNPVGGMPPYVKTGSAAFTGTKRGIVVGGTPIIQSARPSVSGGGSLATGSGSYAATVTSAAATGNVVTPGFSCPNAVVCMLSDETTAGGAKVTASNGTTCTFSATASDTVDVLATCR